MAMSRHFFASSAVIADAGVAIEFRTARAIAADKPTPFKMRAMGAFQVGLRDFRDNGNYRTCAAGDKLCLLLLLMLEAVTTDLVSTISLKRSTQNLQLSTSCRPITHLCPRKQPFGSATGMSKCQNDISQTPRARLGSAQRAGGPYWGVAI